MHTFTQGFSAVQSVRGRSEGEGRAETNAFIQPVRDKAKGGHIPTHTFTHTGSHPANKRQKRRGGAQTNAVIQPVLKKKKGGDGAHKPMQSPKE